MDIRPAALLCTGNLGRGHTCRYLVRMEEVLVTKDSENSGGANGLLGCL